MNKISPCLWFDSRAEEAATFYTSIFKDSKIGSVSRYSEAAAKMTGRPVGSAFVVTFQLAGQNFLALNGGPLFKFSEAISLTVTCEDQAEVDYYWEKLSEGGAEGQCGWLKDRFGLSWQVVPSELPKIMSGPGAEKAMQALLGMKKLDIGALKRAAAGE